MTEFFSTPWEQTGLQPKEGWARYRVPAMFSAANKLVGMIDDAINKKTHFSLCVPCKKEVVYEVRFSCGNVYVGQMGR